jgi:hypothetical protein
MTKPRNGKLFRPIQLLLLLPFIGVLWPPVYNRAEPSLVGIPFFYWYQLAWVFLTTFILWFVYWWERRSTP